MLPDPMFYLEPENQQIFLHNSSFITLPPRRKLQKWMMVELMGIIITKEIAIMMPDLKLVYPGLNHIN